MNELKPVGGGWWLGILYRQLPRQFSINPGISVIRESGSYSLPACLLSLYVGGANTAQALINYWGLNIPAGGETLKIQLSNCEEKAEGGSSEHQPWEGSSS